MPSISWRDDALITTVGRLLLEVQSRLERRLGAEPEARCDLLAWFEVLVRLG